jgi:ribokinase
MVACVGTDAFGDQIVANFQAQDIGTQHVYRSAAAPTGVAPIWVEADGTNRIAVIPGANSHMDPDRVAQAVARERCQVVIGQLEVPQAVTKAAFAAARPLGASTVLNPAPAAEIDPELLALADWLIPNETEFAALLSSSGGAADNDATIAAAITDDAIVRLAGRIPPRLVVTLGEAGAAMVVNDGVLRVEAPVSQAVDTTGAGDAFVGAFAYGVASGLAPADAMGLAVRCASFTVGRAGAQSSFPTPQESGLLLRGRQDVH